MKILSARVSNWKSFPHSDNPVCHKFSNLNVFIGSNGGGKTNYVNAIRLLLHGSIDFGSKRGKNSIDNREFNVIQKPIRIEIEFNDDTRIDKEFHKPNEIVKYKSDPQYKAFFFPKGPEIKLINDYGGHSTSGKENNKNSQLVIDNWTIIRDNFLEFFDIALPENPPLNQELFFEDIVNQAGVTLAEFGSGVVRAFYLMTEILILTSTRKIFLFEEPEVHFHAELLRKFIRFLTRMIDNYEMQFFITTHSPVFIDSSLLSVVESKIFQIKKLDGKSYIKAFESRDDLVQLIYNDLGNRPSELLLANCIIWVEGPSDRIYLNHWIKSKNERLLEGREYTIMFYGGSLISHLAYDSNEYCKFIRLSTISVNSSIVLDSDVQEGYNLKNKKGKKYETKLRIQEDFENAQSIAWITKGKELENYYTQDQLKEVGYKPTSKDKIKIANLLVEKEPENFKKELNQELKRLINWIESKNT